MSYVKIKSPISRNLTSGIKLSVKDAPKMYYDNDINQPVQTYDFYALDSNNANDVVMHLDLRDDTKSVKPPALDYSDWYLYSSQNVYPGIPIQISEGNETGDSVYSGLYDMLALKKQDIINFGSEIGNGFTLSLWVKISHNNPNLYEWHGANGEINSYNMIKTTQCHLIGTVSTANNIVFGISLNRGAEMNRDIEIKGNTLFYIRSADSKYTTGFIKNNILNDEWTNLVWVGDFIDNKLVYTIYINGIKVNYYPIDQEIDASSSWGPLDNGLGFGLWSRTDGDASSEFVSVVQKLNGTNPDLNSSQPNSHGKFQISTFTLYRKPLTDFQVFSDYKYYKERYITT